MKHRHAVHHHHIKNHFKHGLPPAVQLILLIFSSYGINFLLNSVLANHLSQSDYGEFSLILEISLLLSTIVLLGLDSNFIQFGSEYKQKNTPTHAHGLFRWTEGKIKEAALMTLAVSALMCGGLLFHNHMYNNYEPMYFSFFVVPFYAYLTLQMAYLQAYGYDMKAMAPSYVIYPLVFVTMFFGAYIYFGAMDIYKTIAVMGLSYVASGIAAYLLSNNVFKALLFTTEPSHEHTSLWVSSSKSFWSSEIFLICTVSYDVIILKLLFTTSLIAQTMVVFSIGGFIWTIQGVMSKHLTPFVAPGLTNDNPAARTSLIKELKKYNRSMLACGALMTIVVAIFGDKILAIFGQDYIHLHPTLIVYSVLATIDTYFDAASIAISLSHSQKEYKFSLVTQLILGTIGVIVLTSLYGALGVILGYYISTFIQAIICAVVAKRQYGVNCLVL